MTADTRHQFEDAIWAHYQGLKARGWSAPEEGDPVYTSVLKCRVSQNA